jgi:hypothetical protein
MRPWLSGVFVDETNQRLALGALALRQTTSVELGISADHFDGRQRTIFPILERHVRTCCGLALDCPALLEELWGPRVLALTYECIDEWLDAGRSVADVRRALDEQQLRRRLNVLGELLTDTARDPARSHADLVAIVVDLAGMAA